MNKRKMTKLVPITFALLFILLLIGQFFLFIHIKNTNQNSSSLAVELRTKSNNEEYMISTGKIIQNINSDLNKVHKSIVSETGDVEFIESLERLADINNLSISINSLNIEANSKSTTSPVALLRISIKTTGGWSGSHKFLKQVESMPIKMKVNSYTLQSETSNIVQDNPLGVSTGKWESAVDLSVLKYR
ncbi:MAG: hypothetical protein WAZ44_02050 [Minisyncoccia bacterium]